MHAQCKGQIMHNAKVKFDYLGYPSLKETNYFSN
jgi:hypothetical protein